MGFRNISLTSCQIGLKFLYLLFREDSSYNATINQATTVTNSQTVNQTAYQHTDQMNYEDGIITSLIVGISVGVILLLILGGCIILLIIKKNGKSAKGKSGHSQKGNC